MQHGGMPMQSSQTHVRADKHGMQMGQRITLSQARHPGPASRFIPTALWLTLPPRARPRAKLLRDGGN